MVHKLQSVHICVCTTIKNNLIGTFFALMNCWLYLLLPLSALLWVINITCCPAYNTYFAYKQNNTVCVLGIYCPKLVVVHVNKIISRRDSV